MLIASVGCERQNLWFLHWTSWFFNALASLQRVLANH